MEFQQRYFTDICNIAVVTLALFQRSVMDLKKCAKQIKRKDTAYTSHHNLNRLVEAICLGEGGGRGAESYNRKKA